MTLQEFLDSVTHFIIYDWYDWDFPGSHEYEIIGFGKISSNDFFEIEDSEDQWSVVETPHSYCPIEYKVKKKC